MTWDYIEKAQSWLNGSYDHETKEEVKTLMETDLKELEDAFYKNLEFGTGGLRGIMGIGTNRMNRYTVGMATQGFANYLLKVNRHKSNLCVAVAFDCRNNSSFFARITAEVFAANGFKVLLFHELRPTPELSFAIRHHGCVGGVMITASHNPKEYNGYKVYWSDGAQIVYPHDENIIKEVSMIDDPSKVKFSGDETLIHVGGSETDEAYLNAVQSLTLSGDIVKRHTEAVKIVYTPLHGTGVKLVPEALRRVGFKKIFNVPAQDIVDGNFPTVVSPNPEEKDAFKMALEKASEVDADLILATDPDADRLGVAVRDDRGNIMLLNGNQTAAILTYYLLERYCELGRLKRGENNLNYYMVKTIVTSDLLKSIADFYGVEMFNVLTGFKYIAEVVRKNEGKRIFIGGGEESYGFNAGEFVRDKDGILSSLLIAEAAAWAHEKDKSLYSLLVDIYVQFGFYKERLISVTKKGIDGLKQIRDIMNKFRNEPLQRILGEEVVLMHDYKSSETFDFISDLRYPISLPKSDVIQFVTDGCTMVSVRPSGTEPKIKYYLGIKTNLDSADDFRKIDKEMEIKLDKLQEQISSI
jgi:phosphoglucomutase